MSEEVLKEKKSPMRGCVSSDVAELNDHRKGILIVAEVDDHSARNYGSGRSNDHKARSSDKEGSNGCDTMKFQLAASPQPRPWQAKEKKKRRRKLLNTWMGLLRMKRQPTRKQRKIRKVVKEEKKTKGDDKCSRN